MTGRIFGRIKFMLKTLSVIDDKERSIQEDLEKKENFRRKRPLSLKRRTKTLTKT
jgi:hypothetical protein